MNFQIHIFKDLEALSRAAAELFTEISARSIAERGRCLVCLNGGNTPARLFELLCTDFRESIDWQNVYVFWGDERCVPPGDAGSNYGQAWEAFLSRVPIPGTHIFRIKGELEPGAAAKDYALTLSRFASPPFPFPRFDLVYLGMGEDGHTASLFPASPLEVTEPVLPVTAQYQNRPANRVTLTPLVFNQARVVTFMATGEKKAAALAEALSDRYDPERLPVQRINPQNGKALWLVDEEAAGKLPRALTRSFCEG
jgi:6-phosphogluconolactonase